MSRNVDILSLTMITRRVKYQSFTCRVLSEVVDRTLYEKTDGPVEYRIPGNFKTQGTD